MTTMDKTVMLVLIMFFSVIASFGVEVLLTDKSWTHMLHTWPIVLGFIYIAVTYPKHRGDYK